MGEFVTICDVLMMYLAMANTHVGTVADHQKIAQGSQYLQTQCQEFQEKQKKEAEEAAKKESKKEK